MSGGSACIDPYGLLGVTVDSAPADVRRAYYALSLLVHPDKGGLAADMATVHNAYRYVFAQVSTVADRGDATVDNLERDFAEFCRLQSEEPPRFRDIATEEGEMDRFHRDFHDDGGVFDGLQYDDAAAPSEGYGELMVASEYASNSADPVLPTYAPLVVPVGPDADGEDGEAATPFVLSIAPYVAPVGLDAYSYADGAGTDYRMAHNTTPEKLPDDLPAFTRTLEQLLKERDQLLLDP
jgi:hypothetical protein